MLILETSGGRNVFGHDRTPCADDRLPYRKGGPVTEAVYKAYRAQRGECGMQGVGPSQLTWHAYQDRADAQGGCWLPEVNCRIGFGILAEYLTGGTARDAFSRYNTGKPGPSPYADKAMALLPVWERICDVRSPV